MGTFRALTEKWVDYCEKLISFLLSSMITATDSYLAGISLSLLSLLSNPNVPGRKDILTYIILKRTSFEKLATLLASIVVAIILISKPAHFLLYIKLLYPLISV